MQNEALEKAIDEVGRDKVFARAEAHGWNHHGGPPEWVWWGIVQELRDKTPPPYQEPMKFLDFLWR